MQSEAAHHEFAPDVPGRLVADHRGNAYFAGITLPRTYRVKAEGIYAGGGRTPLNLDLVVPAKQPKEFCVETLPSDADELRVKKISFQFWPPASEDIGSVWTCKCGRNADTPHWEQEVIVDGRANSADVMRPFFNR